MQSQDKSSMQWIEKEETTVGSEKCEKGREEKRGYYGYMVKALETWDRVPSSPCLLDLVDNGLLTAF